MSDRYNNKYTVSVAVYNEAHRIGLFLQSIHCADEILVFDKGSTDNTAEVVRQICPAARIISIPFSGRGEENITELASYSTNDWIILCTASDIWSPKFGEKIHEYLLQNGEYVDLILVPRKSHAFGFHVPNSPWSIEYAPFLFHRTRAVITNKLHEHVKAGTASRQGVIAYEDGACINRFSVISADYAIQHMAAYFKSEVAGIELDGIDAKFFETRIRNLIDAELGLSRDKNLVSMMHLALYSIYQWGVILHGAEKKIACDVNDKYKQAIDLILSGHDIEKLNNLVDPSPYAFGCNLRRRIRYHLIAYAKWMYRKLAKRYIQLRKLRGICTWLR